MLLQKETFLAASFLVCAAIAEAQSSDQLCCPPFSETPSSHQDCSIADPHSDQTLESDAARTIFAQEAKQSDSHGSLCNRKPQSSRNHDIESRSASNSLVVSKAQPRPTGIEWGGVIKDSLNFLVAEHAFRLLTEQSTRKQMVSEPFFVGYAEAVGNLHGWSDGDEFYVNYVGHPMQGAVAGYIWQTHDRAFRDVEFGRNRRYWNEKLRGAAFSYVYSVQFEIGPVSEASLGFIQKNPPEMGFVDHVATPTMGLAWTIAEDFMDRDVIQRVETRTSNPYLRILLRGGLNPSRSFANLLGGKLPWHRDDRPGVFAKREKSAYRPTVENTPRRRVEKRDGVAPFEFQLNTSFRQFLGNGAAGTCMGGSGSAAFRLNPAWQLVGEVGGCKMLGFQQNVSGDALDYVVGPRWTPQTDSKWSPHFEVLAGGTKVTQESVDRALQTTLLQTTTYTSSNPLQYTKYTAWQDSNAFAIRTGAGVSYRINSAFAFQLADFSYQYSWLAPIARLNYRSAVQLTGGFILKMGTW